jgi:anti-sigma B factor antagonist
VSISIESREAGAITVLDLTGESSITDGTVLQQAVKQLMSKGKRFFVINLKAVRHLDSFGLGQLVATYQNIRGQKGDLKLVNPNSTVKDLLRYTRIDTVVQVLPSEAEAVETLQKQASA